MKLAHSLRHEQLFTDSDPHTLISVIVTYNRFEVKIHAEFPDRVANVIQVWSDIVTLLLN